MIASGLRQYVMRILAVDCIITSCLFGISSKTFAQTSATTTDHSWLAGRWEGTMTNGPGIADVTFAPPSTGLITGIMRLVADGKVLVVELISITDTPNGPELRFRHFSPALDAYETSFKQALRLTSSSSNRFVFENTVPYDKSLMSTQPRVTTFDRIDGNNFVGHSDVIGNDGKPAVIEVRYRRLSPH
jgi:hypothetical protein